MFLDKSLNIAFLISVILHAAIILPLPYFKDSPVKQGLAPLKITYLTAPKVSPKRTPLKTKAKSQQIDKKKVITRQIIAPKDKPVKKTPPAAQHAKIEIPPELPKEKEPFYLNYYQSIRQDIKKLVIKNYPRFIACGEVCLYFILSSNGQLKEIKIVEERSSNNRLLKEIAKKSLLQASPFSPFPKDLNQAQLSFNVIISFELEN